MTSYALELSGRAVRQLKALPRKEQLRLARAIESLAADPRPDIATNLKELPGCYRLREGDYRIIYAVIDQRLVVLVLAVAARTESYTAREIAAIRRLLREIGT